MVVRNYAIAVLVSLVGGLVFGFSFVGMWFHELMVKLYIRDVGVVSEAELFGFENGAPLVRMVSSDGVSYATGLGDHLHSESGPVVVLHATEISDYFLIEGSSVFNVNWFAVVAVTLVILVYLFSGRGLLGMAEQRRRSALQGDSSGKTKSVLPGIIKAVVGLVLFLSSVLLMVLPFIVHGVDEIAVDADLLDPVVIGFPLLFFSVFLLADSFLNMAGSLPSRFGFLEGLPLLSPLLVSVLWVLAFLGVIGFLGYAMIVDQRNFSNPETSQATIVDLGCFSDYWISCTSQIKVEYSVDGLDYFTSIPYNDLDGVMVGQLIHIEWSADDPSVARVKS